MLLESSIKIFADEAGNEKLWSFPDTDNSLEKFEFPSQSVIVRSRGTFYIADFVTNHIFLESMNSNSIVQVYEKVKADYVKNSTMKTQVRIIPPK